LIGVAQPATRDLRREDGGEKNERRNKRREKKEKKTGLGFSRLPWRATSQERRENT
jgi:hypothetical protein